MIDAELDTMVTTRDGNVVVQIVNGNRLEAEVIFDVEQAIEVGGKMSDSMRIMSHIQNHGRLPW